MSIWTGTILQPMEIGNKVSYQLQLDDKLRRTPCAVTDNCDHARPQRLTVVFPTELCQALLWSQREEESQECHKIRAFCPI